MRFAKTYRVKLDEADLSGIDLEAPYIPMRCWGGGEAAQDLDDVVVAAKVSVTVDGCMATLTLYDCESWEFWEVSVFAPRPRARGLAHWARAVTDTAMAELPWPDIPRSPLIVAYGPALLAEAVMHADRNR